MSADQEPYYTFDQHMRSVGGFELLPALGVLIQRAGGTVTITQQELDAITGQIDIELDDNDTYTVEVRPHRTERT